MVAVVMARSLLPSSGIEDEATVRGASPPRTTSGISRLRLCLNQRLSEPQQRGGKQDGADAADPGELGPHDVQARATKQNGRGEFHKMSRRRKLHDCLQTF